MVIKSGFYRKKERKIKMDKLVIVQEYKFQKDGYVFYISEGQRLKNYQQAIFMKVHLLKLVDYISML